MRRMMVAVMSAALVLAAGEAMAYQSMKQFKNMCMEGTESYFEGRGIPYVRENTLSTTNRDFFEVTVGFSLKLKNKTGHLLKTAGTIVCATPRRTDALPTVTVTVADQSAPMVSPELNCFVKDKFWSPESKSCVNPKRNRSLRPNINDIF